jgi:hypothetical protein
MTQSHDIRYHGDGFIDFDFYRRQANAMRAQALRHGLIKLWAASRLMLTKIIGVTFSASAPAHRV